MKGKCDNCGHVYNITSSPNNIEGYFINQKLWESMQFDLINDIEIEEENKPIYCHKCPECGNISVI